MLKTLSLFMCLTAMSSSWLMSQETVQLSEELETLIQFRVENELYPGLIIGIVDKEGEHYFGYGVKSYKSQEKIDAKTLFEIGSISKTFTGILLADAVLKGELSLNTTLQALLPEGISAPERNGATIQLVQMSNHTSSLPYMPNNFSPADPENPFVDYSEKQLFEFLTGYELTRDIGSQYEYSNYAVGLLGYLLASRKEQSYETLLKEIILEPLGMEETALLLTPTMEDNLAIGHREGTEVGNWDLTTLAGAGGIRSSASDMLTYISANMGALDTPLKEALELSHKNTRGGEDQPKVGLGWHIRGIGNKEIIWHNGGTGGYRTFTGFLKEGNKGVIVMTNSNISVDDIGLHLLDATLPLQSIKPSIGPLVRKTIEEKGLEEGIALYKKLKQDEEDSYNFGEAELNSLGYRFLEAKDLEKALAIFQLNIEAFPKAANPYDSMGEAYLTAGDTAEAIRNYKKSIELNPGNSAGIAILQGLGVDMEGLAEEVEIAAEILLQHVGKYELVPGFILTVSLADTQLEAQATGQGKLPIFPKSETEFYYKAVNAQLIFNRNREGETISVTLNQAGQSIEGKKIE